MHELFDPVFTRAKLRLRLTALAKSTKDDLHQAEAKLKEHITTKLRQAGPDSHMVLVDPAKRYFLYLLRELPLASLTAVICSQCYFLAPTLLELLPVDLVSTAQQQTSAVELLQMRRGAPEIQKPNSHGTRTWIIMSSLTPTTTTRCAQ